MHEARVWGWETRMSHREARYVEDIDSPDSTAQWNFLLRSVSICAVQCSGH